MESEFESFGTRIARERIHKDLSQEELVEDFGKHVGPIDVSVLNDLEQDRIDPRSCPDLVKGLVRYFGLDREDIERLANAYDLAAHQRFSQEQQISSALLAFRRSHR
jgi:transcriptional regulator with XRE-family HTH domain